jgi:Sec-independent protein translocase protein TatA
VALVLIGPDKLPRLARQMGSGWNKLRSFQERIESEVRESMPDLPSSQEIARIARSPVAYLASMAASSGDGLKPDPAAAAVPTPAPESWPVDPGAPASSLSNGHGPPKPTLVRPAGMPGHEVPADPGMN